MYIANQVDEAGMGASRASPTDFLQTRISLNGGADWRPLAPPASFRFGSCNACKPGAPPEQCRLHLHGPTSWFAPEGAARCRGAGNGHQPLLFCCRPAAASAGKACWSAPLCGCVPEPVQDGTGQYRPWPASPGAGPRPNFYSHEGAPGLVIATGNVGPHLDFRSGERCITPGCALFSANTVAWQALGCCGAQHKCPRGPRKEPLHPVLSFCSVDGPLPSPGHTCSPCPLMLCRRLHVCVP
jgi:hypothetical protein